MFHSASYHCCRAETASRHPNHSKFSACKAPVLPWAAQEGRLSLSPSGWAEEVATKSAGVHQEHASTQHVACGVVGVILNEPHSLLQPEELAASPLHLPTCPAGKENRWEAAGGWEAAQRSAGDLLLRHSLLRSLKPKTGSAKFSSWFAALTHSKTPDCNSMAESQNHQHLSLCFEGRRQNSALRCRALPWEARCKHFSSLIGN